MWKYLVDAPFKISDKCCDVMKKSPVKSFENKTGKAPILGIMANESSNRLNHYLRTGCNSFDSKRPLSKPLGFWTEQDILQYIKHFNLTIPSVYGDIIEENGQLKTTKRDRTGCIFCMFGINQEKGQNRFQLLEQTHPQLHTYCMEKLGFKEVCEYMGIKYSNKEIEGQISLEEV